MTVTFPLHLLKSIKKNRISSGEQTTSDASYLWMKSIRVYITQVSVTRQAFQWINGQTLRSQAEEHQIMTMPGTHSFQYCTFRVKFFFCVQMLVWSCQIWRRMFLMNWAVVWNSSLDPHGFRIRIRRIRIKYIAGTFLGYRRNGNTRVAPNPMVFNGLTIVLFLV